MTLVIKESSTMDATAQAELVRRRELTPLELVDAAIARIEQLNPTLNAVITPLFEEARAAAVSPDLSIVEAPRHPKVQVDDATAHSEEPFLQLLF
jgi:Asp-tRNA(Asn)/Glu-tRNA(Gln) amidotransferase A subunit family amidase